MTRIAVSGTGGVIGARVRQRLAQSFDVLDIDEPHSGSGGTAAGARPRGAGRCDVGGAQTLVHLRLAHEVTSDRVRRVLAAADSVRHLTLVSSASVYGAWPNHPTPISEDLPVRPNLEASWAVHLFHVPEPVLRKEYDHLPSSIPLTASVTEVEVVSVMLALIGPVVLKRAVAHQVIGADEAKQPAWL